MRVIARKALRDFWGKHPDAEQPLKEWFAVAVKATWRTPAQIKAVYRNASFLANNRVVFNIKGNDFRLVAAIKYTHGILYIRFIGTHAAYNRIDAVII